MGKMGVLHVRVWISNFIISFEIVYSNTENMISKKCLEYWTNFVIIYYDLLSFLYGSNDKLMPSLLHY